MQASSLDSRTTQPADLRRKHGRGYAALLAVCTALAGAGCTHHVVQPAEVLPPLAPVTEAGGVASPRINGDVSGREAAPVLFDKTGLVVLGCNIHDTMVAWVFIVDTPWFARSGADGLATLRALPNGEYTITTAAPSDNLKSHEMRVMVDGAGTGTVRIPVSLEAGS